MRYLARGRAHDYAARGFGAERTKPIDRGPGHGVGGLPEREDVDRASRGGGVTERAPGSGTGECGRNAGLEDRPRELARRSARHGEVRRERYAKLRSERAIRMSESGEQRVREAAP